MEVDLSDKLKQLYTDGNIRVSWVTKHSFQYLGCHPKIQIIEWAFFILAFHQMRLTEREKKPINLKINGYYYLKTLYKQQKKNLSKEMEMKFYVMLHCWY